MITDEWIQVSLPRGWRTERVSEHADLVNGYPFDSDLFTADGGMPLVRIRDIESDVTEVRYAGEPVVEAVIDHGDILVGMDGDFNISRWKGGRALLNQRVCCVRAKNTVDGRYLLYMLPTPLKLINEFTYSTTVKHLSSFDVLRIHFPYPPLRQQRAIADYLDRETTRLDALVAAKERLLGLLARSAVRSSAKPSPAGSTPASLFATQVSLGSAGFRHTGAPNAQGGCFESAINGRRQVKRNCSRFLISLESRRAPRRKYTCSRRKQQKDTRSASREIW